MDKETIKEIYEGLVNSNYSYNDIVIYFFIKHYINITTYDLTKKRIGQPEFRNKLINRFGTCIITRSDIFDACHIVPYSESEDMDINNGILLNKCHHDYYDKYFWSINPSTYNIEINYNLINKDDYFIKILLGTDLQYLREYRLMKPYLIKHYEEFLK